MALINRLFKKPEKKRKKPTGKINSLKRAIEPFRTQSKVSVTMVDGAAQDLSSHILKVDEAYSDSGAIILDSFTPDPTDVEIQPNTKLQITIQKKGVTVSFKTTVLEIRTMGNSLSYITSIPDSVETAQLRSTYRAAVSKFLRVPVNIYSTGRPAVRGQLENLSQEGAAVSITPNGSEPFTRGEIIEGLYISPPGENPVHCRVEVKQFRKNGGSKKILGVQFLSIKDDGADKLQRLLMDCQRFECEAHNR